LEHVNVERKEQSVTDFGTGCLRKERADCDGNWEQVAGERRGSRVTVFGNRLLKSGEGSV